jgi:hypothetical protein
MDGTRYIKEKRKSSDNVEWPMLIHRKGELADARQ